MWKHGEKSIAVQILSLRQTSNFCAVIWCFTWQTWRDKMCVCFPSNMIYKMKLLHIIKSFAFPRDFLDSPPLVGLSISTHSSMMLSNEKSFPERNREIEERATTRAFSFFHFTKEHISGHHHYQLNDFSLLGVRLECLTSFVSYISESFTEAVFLCVGENAHGWGRSDGKKGNSKCILSCEGIKDN